MATAERVYGRVIGAHHLSEILWGAGKRLAVVTTGKIGNARLLAGRAAELGQPVLSIWGDAVSTPAADFRGLVARLGRPPGQVFPNVPVADWAVTALLVQTPPAPRPDVPALWLNQPALYYHLRRPDTGDAPRRVAGSHQLVTTGGAA